MEPKVTRGMHPDYCTNCGILNCPVHRADRSQVVVVGAPAKPLLSNKGLVELLRATPEWKARVEQEAQAYRGSLEDGLPEEDLTDDEILTYAELDTLGALIDAARDKIVELRRGAR
jgi:hypothetical protein